MSSAAIPSTVCSQTRCRKPGKGDGGGYLPGVNRSSCRRGTPPCRCPDADGRACLMPLPAPPQVFLWRQPDKARPAEAVPDACMGDDPGPSHHPAHRGSNGECTAHTALVWETIQDPIIILLIVAATVGALHTLHSPSELCPDDALDLTSMQHATVQTRQSSKKLFLRLTWHAGVDCHGAVHSSGAGEGRLDRGGCHLGGSDHRRGCRSRERLAEGGCGVP